MVGIGGKCRCNGLGNTGTVGRKLKGQGIGMMKVYTKGKMQVQVSGRMKLQAAGKTKVQMNGRILVQELRMNDVQGCCITKVQTEG